MGRGQQWDAPLHPQPWHWGPQNQPENPSKGLSVCPPCGRGVPSLGPAGICPVLQPGGPGSRGTTGQWGDGQGSPGQSLGPGREAGFRVLCHGEVPWEGRALGQLSSAAPGLWPEEVALPSSPPWKRARPLLAGLWIPGPGTGQQLFPSTGWCDEGRAAALPSSRLRARGGWELPAASTLAGGSRACHKRGPERSRP